MHQFGLACDKKTVDATFAKSPQAQHTQVTQRPLEGSFAVTTHQAWRGSGCAPQGSPGWQEFC